MLLVHLKIVCPGLINFNAGGFYIIVTKCGCIVRTLHYLWSHYWGCPCRGTTKQLPWGLWQKLVTLFVFPYRDIDPHFVTAIKHIPFNSSAEKVIGYIFLLITSTRLDSTEPVIYSYSAGITGLNYVLLSFDLIITVELRLPNKPVTNNMRESTRFINRERTHLYLWVLIRRELFSD